jgi:DNA-binding MarR family transcriptional regulator
MITDVLPGGAASPASRSAPSGIPGSIRLWQAVAAAHAALTGELEADGGTCPVLSADAFAVLVSLADEPGLQLRMHELAERSHLTPSGLTRRVDRLESDGLVDRVGCPGDRRGAFARLTERGLDELERAIPHHAAVLDRYIGTRLDGMEADGLVALLGSLVGHPGRAPERPVDPPPESSNGRSR